MASGSRCLCILSNRAFLSRAIETIRMVRGIGEYQGDILVIRGSDWDETTHPEWGSSGLPEDPNLRVKAFPDLDYRFLLEGASRAGMPGDARIWNKTFQYHKFYVFHVFMKQWERVMYIDAGCIIHSALEPFWEVDCTGGIIAYDEASTVPEWNLWNQFFRGPSALPYLQRLHATYRMDQAYFQSGVMYFDTSIIEPGTFDRLVELMNTYPNALTPDQAILNLYFVCERGVWKPLPNGNPYWYCWTQPGHIITKYITETKK